MSEENRINIMEEAPTPGVAQTTAQPAVEYASITERFVALAIDYGIIFLPLKGLSWLVCKWLGPTLEMWQLIGMVVAINAVFILYETVFSSNGRVTIGKNLVGIAVVKKDLSGPISLPRAFMRAVGYYVSALLFFGGFVLAFVDDRKRTLHDIFGGSAVVQLRERAWWETWAVRGLGALLLVLFVSSLYQSFGGRNWQDKYKVRQAQDFLQNIAVLEEGHRIRYGQYTNDILRLALLSGDPVQFQRDMRQVLSTGRGSLKIGVKGDVYKISAKAKDKAQTPVYFTNRP